MKLSDISKVRWSPDSGSNPDILILGDFFPRYARYNVSDAPYLMGGPSSYQAKFYRRTKNQTNN